VTTTVLDHVGTIEFSAASYAVPENAGSAKITVSRVNGARGTVTVDFATVPINAAPGLDYTPVSGTLTFNNGVTSQTIVVPVLANPYDNHDELVSIVLSNVQTTATLGQAILGTPSTATLTIQDIDPNFSAYLGYTVWGLGQFGDVRVKMYSPPFQVDHYPFSPGTASLKTAGLLIRLDSAVLKSAQAGAGGKASSQVHSLGVVKSLNRPFHSFRFSSH